MGYEPEGHRIHRAEYESQTARMALELRTDEAASLIRWMGRERPAVLRDIMRVALGPERYQQILATVLADKTRRAQ